MDGVDVALRLAGAFYAFAGYVATRAALMSHFVDGAIAAISGKGPGPRVAARTWWLLAAAGIVLAGGLALVAQLDISAGLFLFSAAGQAVYLFIVAPRYFDPADPPDTTGRRQSTNAFVIYLVATAFVLWALAAGRLVPLAEANSGVLAVAAAALVLHLGYVAWSLARAPARRPLFGDAEGWASDESPGDPAEARAIKVMADYHTHPLWALEGTYGDIAPEALGLSEELTRDLNAWAEAYTNALDPYDPAGPARWSEADALAHQAMARPLAVRLAREKPDRTIYVLDAEIGVVEVKPDEADPQNALREPS